MWDRPKVDPPTPASAIARPESHLSPRLDRIVREGSDRDALKAVELGLAYAVGKPVEASESVRVTVPASFEAVKAMPLTEKIQLLAQLRGVPSVSPSPGSG